MPHTVEQRRALRAENARKQAEKAEAIRLKGNEAFKKGDYRDAIGQYMDAVLAHGPRPVLLANLAACYNKLQCYDVAEEIATRALEHDPRAVKVRYRRAVARKNLSFYSAAYDDLETIIYQDPTNAEARRELADVKPRLGTGKSTNNKDDGWPLVEHPPFDFAEDSDVEDDNPDPRKKTPCRFYNRGICNEGKSCKFSHAPDAMSVRDELGRNVCARFLMDRCGSGEIKCSYSHSRAHLPAQGWWTAPMGIECARDLRAFVENDNVDYFDFFEATRAYRPGQGYAARKRRTLLAQYLHDQFHKIIVEGFFAPKQPAVPTSPTLPQEPFVLVVDFDYEGYMESLHKNLFNALNAKIKVVHVRTASKRRGIDFTIEHLASPHLRSVLVTDNDAICTGTYTKVAQKLVEYAKAGGTVVLGGKIANELSPHDFDYVMKSMWGLDWKHGAYFRTIFAKNPNHDLAQTHSTLLASYSMKALHVAGIDMRDAVYAKTADSHLQSHVFPSVNVESISKSDEAPAVIGKVGKGRLGFVGDVNIESGSVTLTLAMLGVLKPKPAAQAAPPKVASTSAAVDFNVFDDDEEEDRQLPPRITDKFVAVLELKPPMRGYDDQFHEQLRGVAKRIQVKVAKTAKDALKLLSADNLHGVLVFDKGIANPPNAQVLKKLAHYAKDGGLVVFAGSFPIDTVMDKDRIITTFSAFGLPWICGTIWARDIQINGTHATALANPGLCEEYALSAHNLQSFHFEDMLYHGGSPTRVESPMLRSKVGKGYVGYMGDTGPEPESTPIILAMFELLNPPRPLVRDEEKFMIFVTTFEKDALNRHAKSFLDDKERKAEVILGICELSKPRVVDLLSSPDLVGVLVGDPEILMPEHAYFLSQLVQYSKNGGTLVFGWLFSDMVTVTQFRPFFRDNWGLNWDMVKCYDTTLVPNPKNALVKQKSQTSGELTQKFDYRGMYVKGISESASVYRPQKLKSLWNPGDDVYTSSLIFTEVEKGKLGYIGSDSLDGECRKILYAMMGIL